jgi:hypothetical protein
MLDSRLTRTVALALTAGAVAAPTAMARPIESGASAVPVVDAHHQALLHRSDAPSSVVNRDLRSTTPTRTCTRSPPLRAAARSSPPRRSRASGA